MLSTGIAKIVEICCRYKNVSQFLITVSVDYYTAWGINISGTYNTNDGKIPSSTAASRFDKKSLFGYKGYYRDEESNYYYLQSRYYIADWCRFINADLPEYAQLQKDEPTGINLFAYCCNDPVNNLDQNGCSKTSTSGSNKTCSVTDCKVSFTIKGISYKLVYPNDPIAFKNDKSWSVLKRYKNTTFNFANFFKNLSLSQKCLTQNAVWANNAVNVVSAVLSGFKVTYIIAKKKNNKIRW